MTPSVRVAEILLVEDEPSDVMLVKKAFENSRLVNRVHVACNGEEALDFVYQRGRFAAAPVPDLVLLDLSLPRISGREVLETIKGDPCVCQIPVIVLSGSTDQSDVAHSYRSRANAYIAKPPNLVGLVTALEGLENFWLAVVPPPHTR